MSKQKLFLIIIGGFVGIFVLGVYIFSDKKGLSIPSISQTQTESGQNGGGLQFSDNPLSIEYLRKQDYPGSDLVIEQTLTPTANYNQYITSYRSEGLKIYGLLTVPTGEKPVNGWPVIIFNHGYIPPNQYKTAEKYESYVDGFARNGYIVFKSDYRGHGNSGGSTEGGHISPAYTIDVLNALSSLKRFKDANPQKIGMWGHSMGGSIALRAMAISKEIKAGAIWAGTVGSVDSNFSGRNRPNHAHPSSDTNTGMGFNNSQRLEQQYGTRSQNPQFWNSIDPLNYLEDLTSPIQLQHGLADEEVNPKVSLELNDKLKALGKDVEYYTYEGDNHNISNNFNTAMQRSVDFFDKNVKGVRTTEE